MTMDPNAARAFVLLCVLAFALFAFIKARQHRSRILREELVFRLFAARDHLYLAAARGEVDCRREYFQKLRNGINVIIREADTVGFEAAVEQHSPAPRAVDPSIREIPSAERRVYAAVAREILAALDDIGRHNSVLWGLIRLANTTPRPADFREEVTRMRIAERESRNSNDMSGMLPA